MNNNALTFSKLSQLYDKLQSHEVQGALFCSTRTNTIPRSHNHKLSWIKSISANYHRYFYNDIYTGISILVIRVINMLPFPNSITLCCPVYRVSFSCPSQNTNLDIVDLPTLEIAKSFAESYYAKWSKVNHIGTGDNNINE